MTNQFPNGELRPTGKQTDRENLSTSGLPATLPLLRCMSPFMARSRHGATSDLSPLCAPKQMWIIRRQPLGLMVGTADFCVG
jgi:hypothetical protein